MGKKTILEEEQIPSQQPYGLTKINQKGAKRSQEIRNARACGSNPVRGSNKYAGSQIFGNPLFYVFGFLVPYGVGVNWFIRVPGKHVL